jgi:DNA-binding transcriptional LysR family regulator
LALRKAALSGLGIGLLPEEYIAAVLLPAHSSKYILNARSNASLLHNTPIAIYRAEVRLLISFLVQWFKRETRPSKPSELWLALCLAFTFTGLRNNDVSGPLETL